MKISFSFLAQYSCLCVQLHFYRPFHISFFHFFLPTMVLVVLTWMVFYIERQRLQSRIIILAFSSLLIFLCVWIFISFFHLIIILNN